MKLHIVTIVFMFLLVSGCSIEVTKQYYPNGKVKAELRYRNGKLDGISKGFYESGKLKIKAYFKDGQLATATCYDERENIIPCPPMKEGSIDEE